MQAAFIWRTFGLGLGGGTSERRAGTAAGGKNCLQGLKTELIFTSRSYCYLNILVLSLVTIVTFCLGVDVRMK